MKSTVWQFTLRRWGELARSPVLYGLFFTFVVFDAVLGPYGKFDHFTFLERLSCSLQVNLICWLVGILIVTPVLIGLNGLGFPHALALVISSICASLALLPILNWMLKTLIDVSFSPSQIVEHIAMLIIIVIVIGIALGARSAITFRGKSTKSDRRPQNAENGPLQQRLSREKRGVLYAMIAQDHYVEFITDKGSQLVLMRFSDAMEQADPNSGVQVHRSGWVSIFGIKDIEKSGRNRVVVLPNGDTVPISRSMAASVDTFVGNLPTPISPVFSALQST